MRTAVGIPGPRLRQANARTALEGARVADSVAQALRSYLRTHEERTEPQQELPERIKMERFGAYEFPVIESVSDETPDFSVDTLKDAESDEDEERDAQVFGR